MASADEFLDGKASADAFLDAPAVTGTGSADQPFDTGYQATVTATGGKIEPKEPGTTDYLLDRAKKGVAGFMGLPGDLVDMVANPPHPAVSPLGWFMRQVADKTGVLPADARIPTEKVIANTKLYRDAFTDPNMTTRSDGLRYAGGVAEMLGAGGPMVAAKGIQLLPTLTSAVGGGFGMEAGGDVAEGMGGNRQVGEAVGSIVGGLGPSMSGSAAQTAYNFLKGRFSPSTQKATAEAAVSKEVLPLVKEPSAAANLDRSLAVSDEFAAAGREFTPSLPARTGSPGLLAVESNLVTRSPSALNKASENIAKNEQEIKAFVDAKFPVSRETTVSRVAKLQRMAMDKLEGFRKAIDDKLDDVARVFERNPSNYEAGAKVRDLVFKQKEVYRGISGQKYQEVYDLAKQYGVTDNIDDVVDYAKRVLSSDMNAYQQSEIPSIFRVLRDKFMKEAPKDTGRYIPPDLMAEATKAKPADVSFEELHSLYKRVNSDIASLQGSSAQDKNFKIMLLGQVKDNLTGKLAKFEEAGYGEVAAKLKEANRFYRDEYVPRFKQGFGGDITAKYGTGEFRVPNEKVVSMITQENNAQAARDFKLLFDDTPEAWQSLRDGYMDKLVREKNVLDTNGRINQKALDTFIRRNGQTLSEFPQIRREFEQLAGSNQALLDRQSRVVAAQKELAAADLYKLFQGKDPAVVIPAAMKDTNAMRLLVHRAKNSPQESQSLARAIAEEVVKQENPVAFFQKNRGAIETGLSALGKDHIKNLETALEAMTINSRSQIPNFVQSKGVAPDAIAEKIGSSPRAIIAHLLNIERGRTGPTQEAAAFLGRWFDKLRRDHKTITMEAVFYDKDAARAIARLAHAPKNEQFRLDFVNQMAALGIKAEVAGQE